MEADLSPREDSGDDDLRRRVAELEIRVLDLEARLGPPLPEGLARPYAPDEEPRGRAT